MRLVREATRPTRKVVQNTHADDVKPLKRDTGELHPLVAEWVQYHTQAPEDCARQDAPPSRAEAKRRREKARHGHRFWSNRLRLLEKEAAEAMSALEASRRGATATAIAMEASFTVERQLDEDRQLDELNRTKKRHAILQFKEKHRSSLRDSCRQLLNERREMGDERRQEALEGRELVAQLRREDLTKRLESRRNIIAEKLSGVVRRVTTHAEFRERSHGRWVSESQEALEDARRHESQIDHAVRASSSLVEKIRSLRNELRHVTESQFNSTRSRTRRSTSPIETLLNVSPIAKTRL